MYRIILPDVIDTFGKKYTTNFGDDRDGPYPIGYSDIRGHLYNNTRSKRAKTTTRELLVFPSDTEFPSDNSGVVLLKLEDIEDIIAVYNPSTHQMSFFDLHKGRRVLICENVFLALEWFYDIDREVQEPDPP